jgi:uroporphyrinogen decarboxylase
MRQAGRYHSHYQALRARHEFIDLCRRPELATAILFSDLLFPLQAMGMGLRYAPGPQLDWHLRTLADLPRLQGGVARAAHMEFQARALELLRARLPASTSLIGFVGGPFTLYAYATAGSHEGFARGGLNGLEDGLYAGFNDRLIDLLAANMALQAQAGADCVAIFDTAAGTLTPAQFARHAASPVADLLRAFRQRCPDTPVIYYSRDTGPAHWAALSHIDLQCLGIDWRHDLIDVLRTEQGQRSVQGNIDPHWLLLPPAELESKLRASFERLLAQPAERRAGWICGLGHGVLQTTPEANVKLALRVQREMFG